LLFSQPYNVLITLIYSAALNPRGKLWLILHEDAVDLGAVVVTEAVGADVGVVGAARMKKRSGMRCLFQ
jgi:hypothetical protein